MQFWNTILFELGGKPVLLIDLMSAVIGLTTVFLAGRNRKSNFYIGYLYTALLFFIFWQKYLYANLILQPISLGINIMGQYRWSHPKKGEESSAGDGGLKVSMLTWSQRGTVLTSFLPKSLLIAICSSSFTEKLCAVFELLRRQSMPSSSVKQA